RNIQSVYVGYARGLLAYAVDCSPDSGLDCHIVSTSLHTAGRIQRAKTHARANKFFQSRNLAMSVESCAAATPWPRSARNQGPTNCSASLETSKENSPRSPGGPSLNRWG